MLLIDDQSVLLNGLGKNEFLIHHPELMNTTLLYDVE